MRAKHPHNKKRKRIGCGNGSGHGKTSTKGQKGQKSRSGYSKRVGFEGGQNPLYRRLPKRGFNQKGFSDDYTVLNLDRLMNLKELKEDTEISPEWLLEQGIIKKLGEGLKILAQGDLKKKLTIKAHRFSEAAKEKIEKAGGQALLIEK